MTMSAARPRLSQSGPAASTTSSAKVFTLADISNHSSPLPGRFGLYAGVGFGKTSLAAHAPSPIFLQTKGETGLETLIAAGQLQPTPHFPEITEWADLLAAVRVLREQEHGYKSLVLDTANGAERLLHEYVCRRDFGGDWGDGGFMSYMRGYEVSLADWRLFLNALDDLRRARGMTLFLLFHSRVKTFKNPNGADYDRYAPEMHDKTWTMTKGWLDHILFGNFEVVVKSGARIADSSKKGKAAEVSHRILYTNSDNPTYDAKNRLGLPDEIDMGASAGEGWKSLAEAIRAARKQAPAPLQASAPAAAREAAHDNG